MMKAYHPVKRMPDILVMLIVSLPWAATADGESLPAFPGAVGQGASAVGGRGGDVYHVTNLSDYGENDPPIGGSLRYGIEFAGGPRTIVFDIGGPLELSQPLVVNHSNLTLAGQTAPGGITLYGYPTLITGADDVVIRYLRFRTGDFNALNANPDGSPVDPPSGNGNMDLLGNDADAISIGSQIHRVILDHLSASWSMDETISINGVDMRDITVQHSIIAESLRDSFHHKGSHGYGSLLRGDLTETAQEAGEGGTTFYGNLYAHHDQRNPAFGGQGGILDPGQDPNTLRALDINFVNNVVYNHRNNAGHRVGLGQVRANFSGNYFINGPSLSLNPDIIFSETGLSDQTLMFQTGNFQDVDQDDAHDGQAVDTEAKGMAAFRDFEPDDSINYDGTGSPYSFIESVEDALVSAEQAYWRAVASVGASLDRDQIDLRYIDDLVNRTGAIIDSQDDVDGLADILSQPIISRTAGFDTDGDGMPDAFEIDHNLNRNDPSDRNGTELSAIGYTNLEVYLNGIGQNADFDSDGDTDGADFLTWQRGFGSTGGLGQGDANGDAIVNGEDMAIWSKQFGLDGAVGSQAGIAVPEPASVALLLLGAFVLILGQGEQIR